MITLAAFEVVGLPAPQGSKRAIARGQRAVLVDGSSDVGKAKTKAWRHAVAEVGRDIAEDEPHDGPLQLSVTFRMPMPASRPKRVQQAGIWPHAVKPDIDKLLRATVDALTDSGLIRDDARLFAIEAEAFEVTGWTGAEIVLRRWEPTS